MRLLTSTAVFWIVFWVFTACSSSPSAEVQKKPAELKPAAEAWDRWALRTLTVTGLRAGELIKEAPVRLQAQVAGAGAEGALLSVVLNDLPAQEVRTGQNVLLKDGLRPGINFVRVFVRGPRGELSMNPASQWQAAFSFESSGPLSSKELSPLGLYIVSPKGSYPKGQPLSFELLTHAESLKTSRSFIRYSLNGEQRDLSGGGPFEFKNLPPGSYLLEAWLVNTTGRAVEGPFAKHKVTFVIER